MSKSEKKRLEAEAKLEEARLKAEAKLQRKRIKAQAEVEKEQLKAQAKVDKKRGEVERQRKKLGLDAPPAKPASKSVRFAESVRGVLYLLLGLSVLAAIVLGQRGLITGFDDIVDSLFLATAGKIILAILGIAFVIYGLKNMRVVK